MKTLLKTLHECVEERNSGRRKEQRRKKGKGRGSNHGLLNAGTATGKQVSEWSLHSRPNASKEESSPARAPLPAPVRPHRLCTRADGATVRDQRALCTWAPAAWRRRKTAQVIAQYGYLQNTPTVCKLGLMQLTALFFLIISYSGVGGSVLLQKYSICIKII